jgi:hypothetical protein
MDWTALIGQIPLVAAFIWFSLEQQKRFDAALNKREDAFDKRNEKICTALDLVSGRIVALSDDLKDHDKEVSGFFGEVRQYMGVDRRGSRHAQERGTE